MFGRFFRLKYILQGIVLCACLFAQTGARYLVITPDVFYNTLQPLIEWKYKKGMMPAVYRLSQIGSDSVSIKNFIVNAYNTWEIKPEYVVLVGHPGYIPMCYYPYGGGWYYTDNYYTNVTGSIYNEILPGRLSVSSTTELETVINKIMQYERYPYMSDTSWFLKGTAIANCDGSDDSIYLYGMRYAESLAVNNGFTSVDTFCNYYGNNASQVITALNQGRTFLLYRGNGNNHWYDPFDVNPYSTANGSKLPIVLSMTCRTVSPGSSPVLGENFFRVGTPTSPRGAVGFIGGTRSTSNVAHLRSAVAIGCLDAMFTYGQYRLGAIAEGGRTRVYQQYGELREYNNFTCLGDPELNVWTDVPCSLTVVHPAFVDSGAAVFTVSVSDAASGVPVENACVCVCAWMDSTVYRVDTTDVNGETNFNIAPMILFDTVYVTVTGRNLQPYEGGMEVRKLNCPYIRFLRAEVVDSATGNGDGLINPTEVIELPLWVENIGESTGVQIQSRIRTADGYVILSDSVKIFGDIPAHDSAYTGEDGYTFTVPYNCPDLHSISFTLFSTDINDSVWESQFSRVVHSPALYRGNVRVEGGNGNGVVDPGETLDVVVAIDNQGSASADSVDAILHCFDMDITLLDSSGWFGHVGIDSSTDNASDPFTIFVDTTEAVGTTLNFVMSVTSNYCSETLTFSLIVGNKHYYLWNPDPSPSSGDTIHAYLSSLGYCGDYGTTLPASLAQYRALLVCLGVYSNRHLITQGSAEAVQLTDYLNSGGRVYIEGSSVWYVDPLYFNGHNFGSVFGLQGVDWSYGDLGPVAGQSGTFTTSMSFTYAGENAYMDHMQTANGGFLIFRDANNYYNCGIARDAGNYKTVGLSFELGGLVDGTPPSTRSALLDSIMKFFGVNGPGVKEEGNLVTQPTEFGIRSVSPNPFKTSMRIAYCVGRNAQDVKLEIFDISGRSVKSFRLTPDALRATQICWDGKDELGRSVPAGVYFIQLSCDDKHDETKVIYLK
jgi:hypothetical protein